MKQKLTRALIDEIRKEMPVLSQNEEKGVIGGTLYVIGVDGRVLYSNENNTDEVLVSMGSWDGAPTMELPKGTSFQISSGQLVIEGTSEQNRDIYSFLTQNTSVEWSMCVDSSTYHFFAGTNHQEKEVSMAYSGCDIKYHNHQSEYANYPSDADYETKSKLQELDIKNFIFIMSQLYLYSILRTTIMKNRIISLFIYLLPGLIYAQIMQTTNMRLCL